MGEGGTEFDRLNLPAHYLADLPAGAELSPGMLREACAALRRNRERYLAHRTTADIVGVLTSVAAQWRDPRYPLREMVLSAGAGATGFGAKTFARGIDEFFAAFTPEAFEDLLVRDLGSAECLDRFVPCGLSRDNARSIKASGPELMFQLSAERAPVALWVAMALGLLARAAQFVRCDPGSALPARLFAHSIYETDSKLGACLEIGEWRGDHHFDEVLFEEADCVIASGDRRFLNAVQLRIGEKARFVPCPRGVSFGYIAVDMLSGRHGRKVAADSASDIAAWDQHGPFAPHVIYVQEGGMLSAEHFAGLLAEELEKREAMEPRGDISRAAAAELAARRSVYALRGADGPGTCCWCSRDNDAWTVVSEAEPRFQSSCLYRFSYVKPVASLKEALHAADAVRGSVTAVGLAAPEHQVAELAEELARWGVGRVCPLGQLHRPSIAGWGTARPHLAGLISWTEWERAGRPA